jgi:type I restriction enzyme S subunit
MSLPQGVNPQRTRIEQGDILVTVTGANVGKCAYVEQSIEEAYPSQSIALVKLKDKSLAPYLQKSIIAPGFGKSQLDEMAYGLGRPVLNLDNIRDLRLPIAPLAEQVRIVAKIEELFSDLDAGVAALKRAKANLKRYRASVLKSAVEGKLTEQWRAKHPAIEPASALLARILLERRQKWEADQLAKFAAAKKEPPKNWRDKYVEPTPPDTTGLPELPDGWCWASGYQLFTWASGDFLPSSKQEDGRIPIYGGNGINGFHNHSNVEFPTLVIGRVGVHCGNVHVTEECSWVTDNAIYSKTIPTDCPLRFLQLCFRNANLNAQSQGGAQPFVNQRVLNEVAFVFPSKSEQEEIVAILEERISHIDAAEKQIEHGLLRASRLRQSILKQAFDGKLVPQDPKDEPASVLLERLRASRTLDEANGTAATSKQTRAKIKESSGEPRTRIRRRASTRNQQEE